MLATSYVCTAIKCEIRQDVLHEGRDRVTSDRNGRRDNEYGGRIDISGRLLAQTRTAPCEGRSDFIS